MAINLPDIGQVDWGGELNAALSTLDGQTVVDARLDDTDLVFTTNSGSEINVGNVQGPEGDKGDRGAPGPPGPGATDGGVAGLVNSGSQTRGALREYNQSRATELGGVFYADDYESDNNYDSSRIQKALDDIYAHGGGILVLAPRDYLMISAVQIRGSGVTIRGVKGKTVFRRPSNVTGNLGSVLRWIPPVGEKWEGLTVEGITFWGGMSNIPELGDNRARMASPNTPNPLYEGDVIPTFEAATLSSAIQVEGDMCVYWNATEDNVDGALLYGESRNVMVRECSFIGMYGLPVFFRGVRGFCTVEYSHLLRSLDPGWVYCESGNFNFNLSEYSMDNGASLSRGCVSVTAIGNSIQGPWYNGVWIGGFTQSRPTGTTYVPKPTYGPVRSIVSNNTINRAGEDGIRGADGFGNVTCTGNVITNTQFPVLNPSLGSTVGRARGVGILISHYSSTQIPLSVNIQGNIIDGASNAGIMVQAAREALIVGNSLRNIGSPAYPNGETRPQDARNNVGIMVAGIAAGGLNSNESALVTNNTIVDKRGTLSRMGYATYVAAGSTRIVKDNVTVSALGEYSPN